MTTHRSIVSVKPIEERGQAWKPEPITSQFRFVVRMAHACHEKSVPYDVTWEVREGRMLATITATGNIPTPKRLPKPARLRTVPDWRPSIWDAEYRLDAYFDRNTKRACPGFVIGHSCGLSLVHPSETGELGGDDSDIRQNWLITHTVSGSGFGLTLNFKRAIQALLLAASFPVEWTRTVEELVRDPEFQRAGFTVIASYGTGHERDSAKRHLEDLERAA